MPKPKTVVLSGYGINCERETNYACQLAGADSEIVHINELLLGKKSLQDYHMLVFPGGFSWGDDHGAGVLEAAKFREHLGEDLQEFIGDEKLVLGICNGFQTLVNRGLLPATEDYKTRSVALAANDCGNFRDQWVHLSVTDNSPCVFTKGISYIALPVRHAEGKFLTMDKALLERLVANKQIVMQYAAGRSSRYMLAGEEFPENPNGSVHDIAGICDPTGRVFGLMPHPEAFNHYTNHPQWTARREIYKRRGILFPLEGKTEGAGIQIFRNAVKYLEQRL